MFWYSVSDIRTLRIFLNQVFTIHYESKNMNSLQLYFIIWITFKLSSVNGAERDIMNISKYSKLQFPCFLKLIDNHNMLIKKLTVEKDKHKTSVLVSVCSCSEPRL